MSTKTAIATGAILVLLVGGGAGGYYVYTQQATPVLTHDTSNHSKATSAVAAAYTRWQQHYVVKATDGSLFVNSSDDASQKIAISEAQGYGLYVTVLAAQQGISAATEAQFDGLYQYYLAHRGHNTQLMGWQQTYDANGAVKSEDAANATDGDLYIAYALMLASKQFPNKGTVYAKQANAILTDVLAHNYNPDKQILTTGSWVTAGTDAYTIFRSSDVLPVIFAAAADFTGDDRWTTLNTSMTTKLRAMADNTPSGLVSDMIDVSGDVPAAAKITSEDDKLYGYNAIRLPITLTHTNNADAKAVLQHLVTFFSKQSGYKGTYRVDGSVAADYDSDLQARMVHVAAVAEGNSALAEKTTLSAPTTFSYYTDTLDLVAQLQG